MRAIIVFLISFTFLKLNAQTNNNNLLVGIWKCSNYDVTVSTFLNGKTVCANLLSFPCSHKIKLPLAEHFDTHNSNAELRKRKMLGIMVLSNLVYDGNNKWVNGNVYVPATGQTYSATIKMLEPNKIIIHGYIGFEFLGKSLIFNKINK